MAKKEQLTKSDYLSMEEFKKLLNCLHKDKQYIWELYARISFCTALRASDVLSLTWSDLLYRTYLVKTEQKTKKTRKIPLNDKVQRYIEEAYVLLKKPNPNELIFSSKKSDGHITIQYVNRIMKEWKVKYNIKVGNFSTHTFRKTFGRNLYDTQQDKGYALVLLNQIFKHSSIEVTKIYIGLRDDEINSVFDSLAF